MLQRYADNSESVYFAKVVSVTLPSEIIMMARFFAALINSLEARRIAKSTGTAFALGFFKASIVKSATPSGFPVYSVTGIAPAEITRREPRPFIEAAISLTAVSISSE